MFLTDLAIRKAKAKANSYKLPSENGLYVLVSPSGGKLWRFNYRFEGKQKTLSLGAYPDVPLASKTISGKKIDGAREKRDEARTLLKAGIDPGQHRKTVKNMRVGLAANTFEVVGREWYSKTAPSIADSTREKLLRRLEVDVYPMIGDQPIANLVAADLIKVIERIEQRGAVDIAKRAHNTMGRIFRYAVGRGMAIRDPSRDIELKDILPPADVQHHASLTDPKAVGGLLRAIDGFNGSFITLCALRLAPLIFVRPGELRHAEWGEFDFEKAEWRIPAEKMKMKVQHLVPLSTQAINILREIYAVTGQRPSYVFPSERGGSRPMSENTVNGALRRLGYTKAEMTGHGFRSTASTLLHELGFPHDAVERQLAHGERNRVSASYNFAEYLPERRKMMQQWSDYLDKLRAGAEVIPLRSNAA